MGQTPYVEPPDPRQHMIAMGERKKVKGEREKIQKVERIERKVRKKE